LNPISDPEGQAAQRERGGGDPTRVGILGGSFNPIHLGHVSIARSAAQRFHLDRVIFVPCKVSPFKLGQEPEKSVSDRDRIQMIALSIGDEGAFSVSDAELRRGGVSYSYDTVMRIRGDFPGAALYFIVGSDTLPTLSQWHKIESLLNLCTFVTVERGGVAPPPQKVPGFSDALSSRLSEFRFAAELLDISSSDIRRKVAAGESIDGLVDSKVEAYIKKHRLYHSAL
jgi:nicotinate-nucleotide adenylyltransferase